MEDVIYADYLNNMGSYLVKWSPKVDIDEEDPNKYRIVNFGLKRKDITSDFVADKIKEKFRKMNFDELKLKLKAFLTDDKDNLLLPFCFEQYAIQYVVKNFNLFIKNLSSTKSNKYKSDLEIVRTAPKYEFMEEGKFYYPSVQNFPAFEGYFKDNGTLYLLQASTKPTIKNCTNGALADFFLRINFPMEDIDKVKVLYFRANPTSNWNIQFKDYTENKLVHIIDIINFACILQ